jgi:hypothetical protein
MSDEHEENAICAFCRYDLVKSPILLDVRRDERGLPACKACYNYLWEREQIKNEDEERRCDVCFAETEDSGVRFLLCDQCWEDIGTGRRVLIEDGKARTSPSELLRGGVWS